MADFTTPVGRLVYGNPATAYPVKDDRGQPKLDQTGQPITSISFGIAIPKQGEQHWNQTQWGALIYQTGFDGWSQMCERPDFAWKVVDGDSQVPNKKGNRPCDKEGYPGHWVLNFSTRINVKLYDYIHSQGAEIMQEGVIKPGHYIQVYGNVEPNNKNNPNVQSAGVYLNPVYVAHSAYGQEIISINAPDVSAVGFGGGQLPPGATTTPQGNFNPAAPAQQPQQGGYPNAAQPQQPQQGGYPNAAQSAGNAGQQSTNMQNAQSPAHGHAPNQQQGGYPNAAQHVPQQPVAAPSVPQTGNAPAASSVPQGYGQPNHGFAQGGQ